MDQGDERISPTLCTFKTWSDHCFYDSVHLTGGLDHMHFEGFKTFSEQTTMGFQRLIGVIIGHI